MRRRPIALVPAAAVVLAIACDLNPQPLPPADDTRAAPGEFSDAAAFGAAHDASPTSNAEGDDAGLGGAGYDAEPTPPTTDGGADDAGDAGDAGDADAS